MRKELTTAIRCLKNLFKYSLFFFIIFLFSNQCLAQSCPSTGNLSVNNDTSICTGFSVTLGASGGGNSYSWTASPVDASLTTPNIANPVVKPSVTTKYTVTASATNLLTNSDFESGNTGFSSQYTYVTGSTFNAGSYSVQTNPQNQNSFFTTCGDHTTGSGKMMVVDGATDGVSKLWCETVTVNPNTDYTFSYWVQDLSNSVMGDDDPAGLNTNVNGSSIGIGVSPSFGLPCGGWIQKTFAWNSGSATTADICINDTSTFPNGNDFALDDISFGSTCTYTASVTVTPTACLLPLSIQATHSDASCIGNDGSINATGINGTAPYTYSINGGTFTSTNTFSGLSSGSYQVSVKDAATPTSAEVDTTIVISGPSLTVSNDTSICVGGSDTLSVSGGNGSYTWTATPADTSLKTPNIANPIVKPSVTTIYSVTSNISPTGNLLINPGFESGNSGFTSQYTYVTSSTFNAGSYSVQTNPSNQNSFFTTCGDHTTGTGNMLVADGATDGISKLWCQSVSVTPNTNYTFSYWIQDLSNAVLGDGHPAGLDAQVNGTSIGIGVSPVFGLPCGNWVQKTFTWNSGITTTADICINDTTTFANGNDFALDDVFFGAAGCTVTKNVKVTATVCIVPLAIQASHTDAGCNGQGGSITALGVNGVAPYTYSINGGAFSSNNTFTGLNGGSYLVTVMDAEAPTPVQVDTTIVVAAGAIVTVGNDTTICSGSSATLSVSGGSNYVWTASPADNSLTTPNIANPVVMPTATTVYTVTSGAPASSNLIVNPAFDNGNTGFTSQYTYVTSSTFNAGSYSVQTNPSNQNSFFTTCGDHTTGTGNMMVIDGATDGVSKIWCESIPVSPNTSYTFSYWIQDLSNAQAGDGHPAGLDAQVNGISIGIGGSPVFGLPCGNWVQKTFAWNSGNAATADICLNDTTTFANGNDFALDDFSFGTAGCTVTKMQTVTVNKAAPAPTAQPVTYCQNATADPLTAIGTNLLWYTTPTGGIGTNIPPVPSTSTVDTTAYYVTQTGATCGESPRDTVDVITIANPTANAGQDTSIFMGQSIVLTGNTDAANPTYLWTPSGITSLTAQVSPQVQTTYTFEVTDNNDGCKNSADVTVNVTPDECLKLMRIFTPNKDGHNDVWIVYVGDCYQRVAVSVYNRWGGLVYHSDAYNNDWDGTYKGEPVPDATYYYVIELTKLSGSTYELTGNVTIMR